jgi:hypothetical protein
MILLRIAGKGEFDDGTQVSEQAREYLAEAALDILSASVDSPGKDAAGRALKILAQIKESGLVLTPRVLKQHDNPQTSMWLRRLLDALNLIQSAALEVGRDSASSRAVADLQRIVLKVVGLIGIVAQSCKDENPGAPHAILVPALKMFEEHYSEYGCVNARHLAVAYLQRYSIRDDVPQHKLAGTFELVRAMSRDRADGQMAEMLGTEGTRLLDNAETKARIAQSATTWSDVLSSVHECHYFFTSSVLAFDWSKARYQKAGIPVPESLLKERQTVEEFRADTSGFLHRSGSSFIYGPIHALMYEALFRSINNIKENRSLMQRIVDSAYSCAGRTPLYPKALLQAWRRIAERVVQDAEEIPVDSLTREARSEFLSAFSDRPVLHATLRSLDKWDIKWA